MIEGGKARRGMKERKDVEKKGKEMMGDRMEVERNRDRKEDGKECNVGKGGEKERKTWDEGETI